MPRLRRRGHQQRDIHTIYDMQDWAKTASLAEIFQMRKEQETGEPWGVFCWKQALDSELEQRWHDWRSAATPNVTDAEILAAGKRFDQMERFYEETPESFVAHARDYIVSHHPDEQDTNLLHMPAPEAL